MRPPCVATLLVGYAVGRATLCPPRVGENSVGEGMGAANHEGRMGLNSYVK